MALHKASVRRARLRAAFCSASKKGKTYVALTIARDLIKTLKANGCLRGNGRIGGIDSEKGRMEEHYGDIFDFDVKILSQYSPEAYQDALAEVVAEDYSVIIIDQISHEWAGAGGLLELHSRTTDLSANKNSFMAWGKITPQHNAFIESLMSCPAHLICTMRAKQDYDIETNAEGKKVPVKLGLGPVQRDNTEYEFDIFGMIDQNHVLTMETRGSLSRLLGGRPFLPGKSVDDPGEVGQIGEIIGNWMAERNNSTYAIPREHIEEILGLGEKMGMSPGDWRRLFSKLGVSSVYAFTPEMYESQKRGMIAAIKKKETAKQASSV